MAYVDLHVHSNASDGTLSPEQVVKLAAEAGLASIALTDHDTTAGVKEAVKAGLKWGVEVIPGIEVSSSFEGVEIHILGLFVDCSNPGLISTLERFQQARNRRNEEILHRLEDAGIHITPEELTGENPKTVITRAHIAQALLSKGYGSSMKQIFKKYLHYGGPFCPPKELLPPEEVIGALTAAHGFAALAHPFLYGLGDKKTEELISCLAGLGMKGLEVYHSSHNQLEIRKLQETAVRCHLLPTGGSDFHGSNKPDISIGTGRGGLHVSSLLLEHIKKFCNP